MSGFNSKSRTYLQVCFVNYKVTTGQTCTVAYDKNRSSHLHILALNGDLYDRLLFYTTKELKTNGILAPYHEQT